MKHSLQNHPSEHRAILRLSGILLGILTVCGLGTLAVSTLCFRNEATAAPPEPAGRKTSTAMFDEKNALRRPADFREWLFIGAPVTPNDLNGGKAAFPEFHNVYVDPASFTEYKRTGQFRDGTVIIKELVSVGGKSMPSGKGYFQGEFVSLEAMVKDTRRFADEPGGWAFFRFGEAPDYNPIGARMKTESCNFCHSAADEDYVFTSTYPVLRAAKPAVQGN